MTKSSSKSTAPTRVVSPKSRGSETTNTRLHDRDYPKRVADRIRAIKTSSVESGAESSNDSAVSTRTHLSSSDTNSSSSSSPAPVDNVSLSSHSSERSGAKERSDEDTESTKSTDDDELTKHSDSGGRNDSSNMDSQQAPVAAPAKACDDTNVSALVIGRKSHKPATRWPNESRAQSSTTSHSRHARSEQPLLQQPPTIYDQPGRYYEDFRLHEDIQHLDQRQQIAQPLGYNPQRQQQQNVVAFQTNHTTTTAPSTSAPFDPTTNFIPEPQYCGGIHAASCCNFVPAFAYASHQQAPEQLSSQAVYTAPKGQVYYQYYLHQHQQHLQPPALAYASQHSGLTFYEQSRHVAAMQPAISHYAPALAAGPHAPGPIYYPGNSQYPYGAFSAQQQASCRCDDHPDSEHQQLAEYGGESEPADELHVGGADDDDNSDDGASCSGSRDTHGDRSLSGDAASESGACLDHNSRQHDDAVDQTSASYQDKLGAGEPRRQPTTQAATSVVGGNGSGNLDTSDNASFAAEESEQCVKPLVVHVSAKKTQSQLMNNLLPLQQSLNTLKLSPNSKATGAKNLMVQQQQQQQQQQLQQRQQLHLHQHKDIVTSAKRERIDGEIHGTDTDRRVDKCLERKDESSAAKCRPSGGHDNDGQHGHRLSNSENVMEAKSNESNQAPSGCETTINEQIQPVTSIDSSNIKKNNHNRNNLQYYSLRLESQQRQAISAQNQQHYAAFPSPNRHHLAPVAINNPVASPTGQPLYGSPQGQQPVGQVFVVHQNGAQLLPNQPAHQMPLVPASPHPFYCPMPGLVSQQPSAPINGLQFSPYGHLGNNEVPNAHKINQYAVNYRQYQPVTAYPASHHQPMVPYYIPAQPTRAAFRSQLAYGPSHVVPQHHQQVTSAVPLAQNFYHNHDLSQQPVVYGSPMLMFDPVAQQQYQHPMLPNNYQLPQSVGYQVPASSMLPKFAPKLPLKCSGGEYLHHLPIVSQPTKTRQAYGMDKVWQDEFAQLFSQFPLQITWTLVEVESNPTIREPNNIVGYKGRYLISIRGEQEEELNSMMVPAADDCLQSVTAVNSCGSSSSEKDTTSFEDEVFHGPVEHGAASSQVDGNDNSSEPIMDDNGESDCDSGALVDSTVSGGSDLNCDGQSTPDGSGSSSSGPNSPGVKESPGLTRIIEQQGTEGPRTPTKFRMFIDSAKVRFCCDSCGHGWTSMKGRVVFWYELFEVVDGAGDGAGGHLIGFCAYKLFGQQCDVCKIDSRFERSMWYPEEVTKALGNLYNKIGQVYFGFKMPAIDKQRRAGKPKTSHNSSLCQACHDGVCTDRK